MAETPPPPFGPLVLQLEPQDDCKLLEKPVIKDCNYIASYSWLDSKAPTILLPGSPPLWIRPANNQPLKQDAGDYFRDPNAARYPSHPMGAAVQAVIKQNPDISTDEIDIFTCASSLGNLLRFVRGTEKEFRFVMEKVGRTVFFTRRERKPTEIIPDVRGYGHTFLEEYTSWEPAVKGSVSHQRIIAYSFAGLRLLVRFEVDGCFNNDPPVEPVSTTTDAMKSAQPHTISDQSSNSDSLAKYLETVNVTPSLTDSTSNLQIKHAGHAVPQRDIFDIKTRSAFNHQTRQIQKSIDMTDILPKLWTSQTPTLIVGYHSRGLFEDIRVLKMEEQVKQWEKDNEDNLRCLAGILHELVEFSRTSRTNLEVCRESGPDRKLEVRRAGEGAPTAMCDELKVKWVTGRAAAGNGVRERE